MKLNCGNLEYQVKIKNLRMMKLRKVKFFLVKRRPYLSKLGNPVRNEKMLK